MTNSYHLLLPGLLVCSLAYLLSRGWTIYDKQVPGRIDSNAHRGDFFVDILAAIRVKELTPQLRKTMLIPEDMTLNEFRKIFSTSQQHYFPVVNGESKLTGIFSINDIRGVIFDKEIGDLVRMKDVANSDIIFTTPSEDLNEVFKKCTIRNLQRVPVVKDEDHADLIGMLDRREMIQFYNQRVQEIKAGRETGAVETDDHVRRLGDIAVKDAMNPKTEPISVDMGLDQIKELIFERGFSSFPVVGTSGRLKGILSISDCKSAFREGAGSLTAGDIATSNVVTVTDHDSLLSALAKITAGDFAILPVVDRNRPDKLVGVISRSDIMTAFNDAILKRGPDPV